jgi:toxin ParE1/3/4
MRLKTHPDAEEELYQGAVWYDDHRMGLGDEFLAHVYRWFDVVAESPGTWSLWPGSPRELTPPIRGVVVDRFPYLIAYQVFSEYVLVLAVAHSRRSPMYWLGGAVQ